MNGITEMIEKMFSIENSDPMFSIIFGTDIYNNEIAIALIGYEKYIKLCIDHDTKVSDLIALYTKYELTETSIDEYNFMHCALALDIIESVRVTFDYVTEIYTGYNVNIVIKDIFIHKFPMHQDINVWDIYNFYKMSKFVPKLELLDENIDHYEKIVPVYQKEYAIRYLNSGIMFTFGIATCTGIVIISEHKVCVIHCDIFANPWYLYNILDVMKKDNVKEIHIASGCGISELTVKIYKIICDMKLEKHITTFTKKIYNGCIGVNMKNAKVGNYWCSDQRFKNTPFRNERIELLLCKIKNKIYNHKLLKIDVDNVLL